LCCELPPPQVHHGAPCSTGGEGQEEEEVEEQEKKKEGEEENVCPNGRLEKKTTPVRKVRGHGRAGQRLFEEGDGKAATAAAGEPAGEVSYLVGLLSFHVICVFLF